MWNCKPSLKTGMAFSYSLKQTYYVTQQISPYSPTQKQTPPTQKHGFGSHFHNSPKLEPTGNVHWPTEGQYNDPPLPTISLCVITIVNHSLERQMENSREREFWSLKLHPVLGHTMKDHAASLHPPGTRIPALSSVSMLSTLPARSPSFIRRTVVVLRCPCWKVLLSRSVVLMHNNGNFILVYWYFIHSMCVCLLH